MSVLNENTIIGASAAGGYDIPNSLRFNDDDSAYLSRTPSVAGNRKTWTWSGWVKRGNLGSFQYLMQAGSSTDQTQLAFNGNDVIVFQSEAGNAFQGMIQTSAVYRDSSAWYHIVAVFDTSNVTEADRLQLYVNNERVTSFSNTRTIVLNHEGFINNNQANTIGAASTLASYLDGYLSEVNFIDGLALTPDSFGEFGDYGEWKPLKYTGAYGTNGFYLDFKDSGSLGNDAAGSNNWTPTNIAATDQMLDSPTNNFATLNALDTIGAASILLEGNLEQTSTASAWGSKAATFGMSSGKWYWEYVITASGAGPTGGIVTEVVTSGDLAVAGAVFTTNGGLIYDEGVPRLGAQTYSISDIIALTYDADVGELKHSVNNSAFTSVVTGKSGREWFPVSKVNQTADSINHNFGQDSSFAGNKTAQGNSDANGMGDFYYAPPAGFLALCTQNLPEPTVIPSEHFNTVLYTGTGAAQSIADVGFQPDLVWTKRRSSTASHALVDAVRGANNALFSDNTGAEDGSAGYYVTSLDSDGFSVNLGNESNASGSTYAAWNWKANGTGVSNTDGTITSTVSANVDAGFSIVTFAGTANASETIGHGLSIAPELTIIRPRAIARSWTVWTKDATRLILNLTGADQGNYGCGFGASVITMPSLIDADWNSSGNNYLMYNFHSVDGYSKVGSYTGNGSADGTFVHCGFRPAYVMIKRTDAVSNWVIVDNTRDDINVAGKFIYPNLSNAEQDLRVSHTPMDFLSNGMKMRTDLLTGGTSINITSATYIFYAVAESPFKHSNAR